MAIVKVYAVRNNLHHSVDYAINEEKTSLDNIIDYAANPTKTEQRLFESTINCSSVDNAYSEMIATKKKYGKTDKVLAYHYIQSFKPGEVTPELAHKIGVEFANECFGDRFEVVIGTHLDRSHLHNHIIVNSVSFADGGKFRSTPESYYNIIRKTSDKLCRENELSVIENPQRKGMHYAEWKALTEGKPTIRGQMRIELDEIISLSKTMIHFFELLRKNGYQIRSGNRKYTAVKPPYAERYIRLKSLGDEYTDEGINERIKAARNGIKMTPPSLLMKRYKFKGSFKNLSRKKLTGFMALYFKYLYLFKKIRKRQTPKMTSAFLRAEITKLGRYQKQFHFICEHNIESPEQLMNIQSECEDKIKALMSAREPLYKERKKSDEQGEISERISKINAELKMCRQTVKMCKSISEDAQHIEEKYNQAQQISAEEIKKEARKNEHKRRSR